MQVLYEGLADSKYRPCPLLVKYVEAGWLGRKTKRGFYDYRGEKPVPTRYGSYFSSAAVTSLTASALAHSAGPAMVPISHPAASTSSVVGIPAARPMIFKS